jgi:hypothetical protein
MLANPCARGFDAVRTSAVRREDARALRLIALLIRRTQRNRRREFSDIPDWPFGSRGSDRHTLRAAPCTPCRPREQNSRLSCSRMRIHARHKPISARWSGDGGFNFDRNARSRIPAVLARCRTSHCRPTVGGRPNKVTDHISATSRSDPIRSSHLP